MYEMICHIYVCYNYPNIYNLPFICNHVKYNQNTHINTKFGLFMFLGHKYTCKDYIQDYIRIYLILHTFPNNASALNKYVK